MRLRRTRRGHRWGRYRSSSFDSVGPLRRGKVSEGDMGWKGVLRAGEGKESEEQKEIACHGR